MRSVNHTILVPMQRSLGTFSSHFMRPQRAISIVVLLIFYAFLVPYSAYAFDKAVYAVQKKLSEKGYNVTADGIAGKQTKDAIKSYRIRNELRYSQEIDEALLRSLGIDDEDIKAAYKPKKAKKTKKADANPFKNPYPKCQNLYMLYAGNPYVTGDFKNFKPDFRGYACCDGEKSNWKSTVDLLPFEAFHGKPNTMKWNSKGELVVVFKEAGK